MSKLISTLKIAFQMLFIVCVIMFITFYVIEKMDTDTTYPVITVKEDKLVVSINATEADLLANVTAYDEKDGDLTDRVIIESISDFVEPSVCRLTYAVCDADNHVVTKTIRIRYEDYQSPRFSLNRALVYSLLERVNISAVVSVHDVIDGNLNKELGVTSEDYQVGTVGVSYITMDATNSKGDRVSLKLPVYIEEIDAYAPTIELSTYLYYAEAGEDIDPLSFLVSAKDANKQDVSTAVVTEIKQDCLDDSVYSIHYYVTDEHNRRGHSCVVVVVQDE